MSEYDDFVAQDEEEGFDDAVDDVSYTVYQPKKLKLGMPHPDPVVENTSMAAVDPPELCYRLKLQVGFRVTFVVGVSGLVVFIVMLFCRMGKVLYC